MDAPQTENLVTTSCAASPCLRPGKSLTSEILRKMQADIAYPEVRRQSTKVQLHDLRVS